MALRLWLEASGPSGQRTTPLGGSPPPPGHPRADLPGLVGPDWNLPPFA